MLLERPGKAGTLNRGHEAVRFLVHFIAVTALHLLTYNFHAPFVVIWPGTCVCCPSHDAYLFHRLLLKYLCACPCRILVSSTRKPISYINLAKRFLQEHGEVQLSALGIAVAPMVTVAEILKNRRLAVERKISTSLEALSDDYR